MDEVADDNVIQSFQLEASNLRGRVIRLGGVLDDILKAHDYPKPVAHLVAETSVLALLLSSMLKYEGIFTLQAQGDGPVGMVVADVTDKGDLRACATFDEERLGLAREQVEGLKSTEGSRNHLAQYLGKGYVAFTVDPKSEGERYQGIVELQGSSLVDCVQHYFSQSEQIMTGIKMAVGQRDGVWRGGGIMLQRLPEDAKDEALGNTHEDDWRRAMILMESTKEDEMLDPALHSNTLLMRLYHEEGIRVYEPVSVQKICRCSEERVFSTLQGMSVDDWDYMTEEDGMVKITCEFCSQKYSFKRDEFKVSDT